MSTTRYAVRIVSLKVQETQPPQESVRNSNDATRMLGSYFGHVRDDRERMIALALNRKYGVLGIVEIALGGASATMVDPKVLFRTLLTMGASAFILAHNHPSGDPTSSPEDVALTHRLIEGGKLLDVQCVDHLIFGDGTERVVSFLDTGQCF